MANPIKPEGYSWASPYITVADVPNAMAFYNSAFNFQHKFAKADDDGQTNHGEMTYKDQVIMMGKEGAYEMTTKTPKNSGVASPINLYLYTENVDDFYEAALAAGATSDLAPQDMFWGDRMCRLIDPDGYVWSFATCKTPCQ